MRLPSDIMSPSGIEEGAENDRENDDIGDIVCSISREARFDEIVVVERVEEVEAKIANQEVQAQSEVS